MKYLAILGNTPALSALELGVTWSGGSIAELNHLVDINRLGGTIKLAEVMTTLPRSLDGITMLQQHLQAISPTVHKLYFGFSIYAAEAGITPSIVQHYAKKLHRLGIDWKKTIRQTGQSIRFVESKAAALASVIVKKEHLLDQQTDLIVAVYKNHVILAKTIAIQNYKAFAEHDFGRPKFDKFSGMLPPKVARMMVNIAQPQPADTILDPFCGSGTILQEALLLGYTNVIGADVSKKSIEDSTANLAHFNLPTIPLHQVDVLNIESVIPPQSIDCLVSEGYLGPVLPKKTDKVHRQLTKFYNDVLVSVTSILKPEARLVVAIPAWRKFDSILTIDLQATIARYYKEFHPPIFMAGLMPK